MFALERQKKILDTLSRDGSVFVSKLSSELGVTEETIRRDLEKLEKQESLRRTHGGAVPIDETTYELSLEKRKSTNVDAKKRLAKKASEYVVSGDTIFLDASTTTFFMAKEIKHKKNVTVITNSIRVLGELASVMCALLYPLLLHAFIPGGWTVLMGLLTTAFVVFMHRENIKRLLAGKESKVSFGKKKKTDQQPSPPSSSGEE